MTDWIREEFSGIKDCMEGGLESRMKEIKGLGEGEIKGGENREVGRS